MSNLGGLDFYKNRSRTARAATWNRIGKGERVDVGTRAGEAQRQDVQDEAGIDSGTGHGHAVLSGQGGHALAERRITLEGVEQFLG